MRLRVLSTRRYTIGTMGKGIDGPPFKNGDDGVGRSNKPDKLLRIKAAEEKLDIDAYLVGTQESIEEPTPVQPTEDVDQEIAKEMERIYKDVDEKPPVVEEGVKLHPVRVDSKNDQRELGKKIGYAVAKKIAQGPEENRPTLKPKYLDGIVPVNKPKQPEKSASGFFGKRNVEKTQKPVENIAENKGPKDSEEHAGLFGGAGKSGKKARDALYYKTVEDASEDAPKNEIAPATTPDNPRVEVAPENTPPTVKDPADKWDAFMHPQVPEVVAEPVVAEVGVPVEQSAEQPVEPSVEEVAPNVVPPTVSRKPTLPENIVPKTKDEQQKARLESLEHDEAGKELKDAARAYAQARYDAEVRVNKNQNIFKKIARNQGFFEKDIEKEISGDSDFQKAEEALFVAREKVEAELDERVAQRVSERKTELADDAYVVARILRQREGVNKAKLPTEGVQPSAVTPEEIAKYREDYEAKLEAKTEKLKHTLRYAHINAPLRQLRLEVEKNNIPEGDPTKIEKAMSAAASWYRGSRVEKAVKWYRGDGTDWLSRQRTIGRNVVVTNACIASTSLAFGGIPLALYFGARIPVKLASALIGANAGMLAAKRAGKWADDRSIETREKALSQALVGAKQGTEEGRKKSLTNVFRADERFDRGQKRKVAIQVGAGVLVGATAGSLANDVLGSAPSGVIQETAKKVVDDILDHKPDDIKNMVNQLLERAHDAKTPAELFDVVRSPITHPPGVATPAGWEAGADSAPDGTVLHDPIPHQALTHLNTDPGEPTPVHLEGAYDTGESVESVLRDKLLDTHAELDKAEAGAVAHRIALDLKDNAEVAQGFGVENGKWDMVDKGEAYKVDIDQSLIDTHIVAVENPGVGQGAESVAPPTPSIEGAVESQPTVPKEVIAETQAVEQVTARFRPNAFMTHEVVVDVESAQRSVHDWIGAQTRPALEQILRSNAFEKNWVTANQPFIRSNWGVINDVPVDKLFDRTPGIRYLVHGTNIELLPDTERYLRTFMNRLERLPGASTILHQATQEHWTVGQVVQELVKKTEESVVPLAPVEKVTDMVEQAVSQPNIPAQPVDVPGARAPFPRGITRTNPVEPEVWVARPQEYRSLYGGPVAHGGMQYPYGRGSIASAHAGGIVESGPVAMGGSVRAEFYPARGTQGYRIPSGVDTRGIRDINLQGKFGFDVGEAAVVFREHPAWNGQTFGQLMQSDPEFARIYNREVLDAQMRVAMQTGLPRRLLPVDVPPADMPAQEALAQMKHVESVSKYGRYNMSQPRWPRTYYRHQF